MPEDSEMPVASPGAPPPEPTTTDSERLIAPKVKIGLSPGAAAGAGGGDITSSPIGPLSPRMPRASPRGSGTLPPGGIPLDADGFSPPQPRHRMRRHGRGSRGNIHEGAAAQHVTSPQARYSSHHGHYSHSHTPYDDFYSASQHHPIPDSGPAARAHAHTVRTRRSPGHTRRPSVQDMVKHYDGLGETGVRMHDRAMSWGGLPSGVKRDSFGARYERKPSTDSERERIAPASFDSKRPSTRYDRSQFAGVQAAAVAAAAAASPYPAARRSSDMSIASSATTGSDRVSPRHALLAKQQQQQQQQQEWASPRSSITSVGSGARRMGRSFYEPRASFMSIDSTGSGIHLPTSPRHSGGERSITLYSPFEHGDHSQDSVQECLRREDGAEMSYTSETDDGYVSSGSYVAAYSSGGPYSPYGSSAAATVATAANASAAARKKSSRSTSRRASRRKKRGSKEKSAMKGRKSGPQPLSPADLKNMLQKFNRMDLYDTMMKMPDHERSQVKLMQMIFDDVLPRNRQNGKGEKTSQTEKHAKEESLLALDVAEREYLRQLQDNVQQGKREEMSESTQKMLPLLLGEVEKGKRGSQQFSVNEQEDILVAQRASLVDAIESLESALGLSRKESFDLEKEKLPEPEGKEGSKDSGESGDVETEEGGTKAEKETSEKNKQGEGNEKSEKGAQDTKNGGEKELGDESKSNDSEQEQKFQLAVLHARLANVEANLHALLTHVARTGDEADMFEALPLAKQATTRRRAQTVGACPQDPRWNQVVGDRGYSDAQQPFA